MRYFIEFAYNGKNYHGWQQQPNAPSVQETLGKALSVLLRDTIEIMGAGRTDTGVHAKQMFAHFNVENSLDIDFLKAKLNSYLPKDIAIIHIHSVSDDAHARFDAVKRTYEYHINTIKDVFEEQHSWYFHQKLDIEKMNQAAKILFEFSDFQCFSKVNTDVKTFQCKIMEADWKQNDNKLIFTIAADRFLRNMVRAIVGTLVEVGIGKTSLEDFRKIIESKDRNQAGPSAPAHGLFLTKVEYPYIYSNEPADKK
ncbi:tRNA pseudouridine(38-40) synthase TruA [Flavobacterium sp. WW92]|uniref:tRNA pseudouridine(38-40) synthase TruA n=1 Tax=unclassified Flavobacterium TaxID=196869 RepID=UPI0022245BC4|nr:MULTISPECIES: tRNA pseudouridine(38-40) synthase TruA [unclassified Flavobacterium]WDO12553.1 tRNA pseudouridine(38-40) synthase TruA [Flavobacterium sp. WW92]